MSSILRMEMAASVANLKLVKIPQLFYFSVEGLQDTGVQVVSALAVKQVKSSPLEILFLGIVGGLARTVEHS
jgi:hypothetical protein